MKARIATRLQPPSKSFDIKAIKREATEVNKVVPNVLVDKGSGLNILLVQTIEKLGFSLIGLSSFVINMAN